MKTKYWLSGGNPTNWSFNFASTTLFSKNFCAKWIYEAPNFHVHCNRCRLNTRHMPALFQIYSHTGYKQHKIDKNLYLYNVHHTVLSNSMNSFVFHSLTLDSSCSAVMFFSVSQIFQTQNKNNFSGPNMQHQFNLQMNHVFFHGEKNLD